MNLQNNSTNPLAFQNVSTEEKNLTTIMWILSFFTSFIGPLLIWLMKKDESEYINQQGKNCLNFIISYGIYVVISTILTAIVIGAIFLIIIGIATVVYCILGAVANNKGEDFKVPFTFEILK
ncbi:DUF4870 domain-containing protein [Mammaliicoccus vitulinus]|uniref:DUF4870 domain-containing protein n=1 Tax=Mammaliicoccus vitulinus TaxID=71237 RepID=A0ABX7HHG1_9STAP|nr:DUF4870 domain-containing protein [Mammaliicoccus vitulinus]PNZ39275.1 DUF4870 domain-containing protein [Mammaliicoccus vitulinus]PTI37978.1 DUF4870 domain-containing protein [Mammaliicoccus vitulinus]QRO86076.1 DUF4870 domain-containing protein [Mammaliicoccus vitulinus]RIL47691.1 DUF4870 domain-containing protein [Mammaliicoccus fleurettii]